MSMYLYKIVLFFSLLGLVAIPFTSDAFGHGLGADQAPPINFEGMDVTVRTELTPYDITAGQIDDANMGIRFFDTLTNTTLNDVTYRVEVYRSGDLLARNHFYDIDGYLNIEVRPVLSCSEIDLWRCTTYYGEKHPIAGALFARGEGRPVIQGPIFDKGGLYNIQVIIEGATSPKTLLMENLQFETFVSVSQEQNFIIQTAQAQEVPLVVKTYYDDITTLDYSTSNDSISFEMPFDWDPDYISQVQIVHEEIQIPKSFEPYADVTDFKGYVNGIEVDNRILLLDPYSSDHTNIIHFLVNAPELQRINQLLGSSNYDSGKMTFELVPQSTNIKNSAQFYLVDPDTTSKVGSTVDISWDSKYGVNDEIPFDITFFDENGDLLKDVKYAYYVFDSNDNKIHSAGDDPNNLGIDALEGIDVQKITIPTQEQYRLDVWLLGQGIDFDPAYSGAGSTFIEVGPSSSRTTAQNPLETTTTTNEIRIPSWVKSNAGFWSSGEIDDATFINGIQYMIKEKIIIISSDIQKTNESATSIPSWVKSNAGFWSDGLTDDQTFVNGLQWLINNGIIVL